MNTSHMLLPQDFCICCSLPWDPRVSNVYSLAMFFFFCPNIMLSLRSFVAHPTEYYKTQNFLSPFLTYYTFLHNTHHLLVVYIFYSFMLCYDVWCLSKLSALFHCWILRAQISAQHWITLYLLLDEWLKEWMKISIKIFYKIILYVGRSVNMFKSISEIVGSLKIRYLDLTFKVGRRINSWDKIVFYFDNGKLLFTLGNILKCWNFIT